jgi:hypothetical protein
MRPEMLVFVFVKRTQETAAYGRAGSSEALPEIHNSDKILCFQRSSFISESKFS